MWVYRRREESKRMTSRDGQGASTTKARNGDLLQTTLRGKMAR